MNTREIIFLLQGIYLFSSRTASEHQDDSDLDMAMLLHPVAAENSKNNVALPCSEKTEQAPITIKMALL